MNSWYKEAFQSTLPIQGETEFQVSRAFVDKFQSTLPIQGETLHLCYNVNSFYYFNPLSLYRERPGAWPGRRTRRHFNPLSLYRERPTDIADQEAAERFQSTLPIQGETRMRVLTHRRVIFQSTLPIQGETVHRRLPDWGMAISIHSPYTGRDDLIRQFSNRKYISIHSPYTGRDKERLEPMADLAIFQSTLPIQGETLMLFIFHLILVYFNPLSLYRERPRLPNFFTYSATFQSTLPIQGETSRLWNHIIIFFISIHSPYTGRDSNFAHKTPNIQPISYAKRQTKELFPTPTQQIITSLALISSISRCESPCIFMCTSHSH